MTRKIPNQHHVKSHERKGKHGKKVYVRSYKRGYGFGWSTREEAIKTGKAHSYLMPRDKEKTTVMFRKWVKKKNVPEYAIGDITALFPDIQGSPGYITSYNHIGQHGDADYNYMMTVTVPAKPSEYADLKEELEGLGYYLDVKQKRTKFGAELRSYD